MLVKGPEHSVRRKALDRAQERAFGVKSTALGTGAVAATTTPAAKKGGGSRRGSARQSTGGGADDATAGGGGPSDRDYVPCRNVQEQAACLVDLAMDAGVLAHTWGGWKPWL